MLFLSSINSIKQSTVFKKEIGMYISIISFLEIVNCKIRFAICVSCQYLFKPLPDLHFVGRLKVYLFVAIFDKNQAWTWNYFLSRRLKIVCACVCKNACGTVVYVWILIFSGTVLSQKVLQVEFLRKSDILICIRYLD